MNSVTKLINCGGTVLLHEFRNKSTAGDGSKNEMEIDKLRVSLLTNFVNDQFLAVFHLKVLLSEYGGVEQRLRRFINELKDSSGSKDIRYMAVTCPPKAKEKNYAIIYLITSIEFFDLTASLENEVSEDMVETYYKRKWKNELSIEAYTDKQLIETFTTAYKKGLKSKVFEKMPIKFRGNLKSLQVLYNEEADRYMKKEEVLNYPYFKKEEIFSNTAGYSTLYEYSQYDITSPEGEEEFDWYRKHCRIT